MILQSCDLRIVLRSLVLGLDANAHDAGCDNCEQADPDAGGQRDGCHFTHVGLVVANEDVAPSMMARRLRRGEPEGNIRRGQPSAASQGCNRTRVLSLMRPGAMQTAPARAEGGRPA